MRAFFVIAIAFFGLVLDASAQRIYDNELVTKCLQFLDEASCRYVLSNLHNNEVGGETVTRLYIARSYALHRRGDKRGAVVDYALAIDVAKNYPGGDDLQRELAELGMTLGQWELAQAQYAEVLRLVPGDYDATRGLTEARHRADQATSITSRFANLEIAVVFCALLIPVFFLIGKQRRAIYALQYGLMPPRILPTKAGVSRFLTTVTVGLPAWAWLNIIAVLLLWLTVIIVNRPR